MFSGIWPSWGKPATVNTSSGGISVSWLSLDVSNETPSWGLPFALVFSGLGWVKIFVCSSANWKLWLDWVFS